MPTIEEIGHDLALCFNAETGAALLLGTDLDGRCEVALHGIVFSSSYQTRLRSLKDLM